MTDPGSVQPDEDETGEVFVDVTDHSRGRWKLACEGCGETWYPSKLAGMSPYAGSACCPWCGHDASDRVRALAGGDA